MDFEWDAEKAAANEQKHGATFEEAAEVFADDHSSTVADPDHSGEEERSLIFGVTKPVGSWSYRSQTAMIESGSSTQDR